MKKHDEDFDLVNLPVEAQDPSIKEEDFVLQQADGSIHEQKFQTKPTTFLKDSLKRFRKNKSSVVAAYILGFLILLAIFVPIFSPYDVSTGAGDIAFNYLEPKLFESGTGFWDGTVKKTHIPVDTSAGPDKEDWWPNPEYYKKEGISNYHVGEMEYTTDVTEYGKNGYARIGYYGSYGFTSATIDSPVSTSLSYPTTLNLNKTTLTLTKFDTVDEEKAIAYHEKEGLVSKLPEYVIPENFELGNVSLEFNYMLEGEPEYATIVLTDKKVVHNTGSDLDVPGKEAIVISDIIKANTDQREFDNFYFSIRVEGLEGTAEDMSVCTLLKGLSITATGDPAVNEKAYFEGGTFYREVAGHMYKVYIPGISFTDAMEFLTRSSKVYASDHLAP